MKLDPTSKLALLWAKALEQLTCKGSSYPEVFYDPFSWSESTVSERYLEWKVKKKGHIYELTIIN